MGQSRHAVLIAGNGERLWTIEPDNSYASDVPVRWAPGRDLIAVLTTPEAAGFYDGFGRRVLPFPDAEPAWWTGPLQPRPHRKRAGGGGADGQDSVLIYTARGRQRSRARARGPQGLGAVRHLIVRICIDLRRVNRVPRPSPSG